MKTNWENVAILLILCGIPSICVTIVFLFIILSNSGFIGCP